MVHILRWVPYYRFKSIVDNYYQKIAELRWNDEGMALNNDGITPMTVIKIIASILLI